MDMTQFFTLIGMLAGGFGWIIFWLRSIDGHLNDLDKRVTIIETVLAMMGMPMKERK